ncbi:hypothetical protein [Paraburkholderia sp. RL17-337-BIB-A]|uniref:hypothetical protein n=1 Tax=Paraburkholderia sp. RL17-337-BIB-A TaxID=3031636 RepID=UPI0038B86702
MSDSNGTARVSIPFGNIGKASKEELTKHSFDLVHFPMYLDRHVPPRVRIEITDDYRDDIDLTGLYENDQNARCWKYVSLIADDNGCPTDSDEFYRMVHGAFGAHADGLTYIGFRRGGPPVYAPLFALAMLYQKYGCGIFLAGEMLPTPWPESTVSYTFTLR